MSPELELQGEIVDLLRNNAALNALVGTRVYDAVPDNRSFPYVSMGPMISTSQYPECIDSMNIAVQIDVWSRETGYPECKIIADEVRLAVNALEELPVNALVMIQHNTTNTMRDPDGLTSHSALYFDALVERQ